MLIMYQACAYQFASSGNTIDRHNSHLYHPEWKANNFCPTLAEKALPF